MEIKNITNNVNIFELYILDTFLRVVKFLT